MKKLIEKIEKLLPSWALFSICKEGMFWSVKIQIESMYFQTLKIDTTSTTLKEALYSSYSILKNWAMTETEVSLH